MQTYTAFFNTEPQIGALVVGMTAGLEEAKANGQPIDSEAINGIRAGLMGPLAGIGDSMIVGTLIPILLGIALGLSGDGSPLGAIFYIVVWNFLMWFGMRFAYFKGYDLGGKAVEVLVGEQAQAIRDSIIMIGDDCHRLGGSFLDQYQYFVGITGWRRSAKNAQWHLSQNAVGAGRCFLLVVDDSEKCFPDHGYAAVGCCGLCRSSDRIL